jgi:glycosyltransferase involved in cell wall biosynthesis
MDIMPRREDPGYHRRLREMLQALPMVLARSDSLAERLVELGCDPRKIRINRTGIPMDGFPFRERGLPPDGAWRLVQASRFIERKGLCVTLEAFARFQKVHPKAELLLAGDGPLKKDLEHAAGKLGVATQVKFSGFLGQKDLAEAFHAAHFFVHPSQVTPTGDQEGVPNSMLEAMATGLPIMATKHGGIPEAVTSGHDGILAPERDPEALARALLETAADAGQYQRFSRQAAESVREKFGQARSIEKLEGFYRELIS